MVRKEKERMQEGRHQGPVTREVGWGAPTWGVINSNC